MKSNLSGKPIVRPACMEDGDLLTGFRCSNGAWYEQQVERYIQTHALGRALSEPPGYRLLLAFNEGRLLGCMAHQQELLFEGGDFGNEGGRLIRSVRLHLFAIALDVQGRKLSDGRRLSDALMATLIFDAIITQEQDVLTAVVALDNIRSIVLCERHGLRSQTQCDAWHVRLSGRFTLR